MLSLLLISAAFATSNGAIPQCSLKPPYDGEREVYLLTASAGLQPFSFLGHSALWVRDPDRRVDHILEFGAIDSAKQEPLSSLLLGTLECTWWTRHIKKRKAYFERRDRASIAHQIVLPPEANTAFWKKVNHTLEHQDDTFLFDALERSCATEIRDMLNESLDGALAQSMQTPTQATPKNDVLRHLAAQPWAWFALNTLNPQGQLLTNTWNGAFLPDRLLSALSQFHVDGENGSPQPVLGEPCRLTETTLPAAREVAPEWTPGAWAAGLFMGALTFASSLSRKRILQWVGGLGLSAFGLLFGLLGTALFLLASFSDLTYLQANGNMLVSHPLTLGLIPIGLAIARRRYKPWMRYFTTILLVLATLGAGLACTPWSLRGDWATLGLTWPMLFVAAWLCRNSRMKWPHSPS